VQSQISSQPTTGYFPDHAGRTAMANDRRAATPFEQVVYRAKCSSFALLGWLNADRASLLCSPKRAPMNASSRLRGMLQKR
jgi:hypothetical protein